MAEKPILFSGEMVRAILSGRKTQTRRVVKPQPDATPMIPALGEWSNEEGKEELLTDKSGRPYCIWPVWSDDEGDYVDQYATCPYGAPGDQLWVRETWYPSDDLNDVWGDHRDWPECEQNWRNIEYRADGSRMPFRWRPSIHMPRWASRLTLTVKGVRVERLKDISEADAEAEGCSESVFPAMVSIMTKGGGVVEVSPDYIHGIPAVGDELLGKEVVHVERSDPQVTSTARDNFIGLWNRINYGRGFSWDSNPWVWVVEFEPAAPAAGQEDEK